jgi:hypothetical protein
LKKERPRAGKRKPIEKDDDEDDLKKEAIHAAGDDKAEGDKKDGAKETGVIIHKATIPPAINATLTKNFVSLQATKNLLGGRKIDDGNEEEKKKKKIEYTVDAILLNNNEVRDLSGLFNTLTFVLPHSQPSKLLWINLSYNFLTKIDNEIL